MEAQSPMESPALSADPIARARLWVLLPIVVVAVAIGQILIGPSPRPDLELKAGMAAGYAPIILWWLLVVAGGSQRAGFRSSAPSIGAALHQGLKVALGCILATLVWVLAKNVLGIERAGLVEHTPAVPSERAALSLGFIVLQVGVLAPVAEEMLFRGALFRKWRLRLGPAKAAVLTSVLFGLGHENAPNAALFGLAMAVLYTTTRTLWAPVVAHIVHNLFGVTLVNSVRLVPLAVLQAAADWPLQLASLVPGLLGTWWLVRFLRREWHTLGDPVHGEPVPVAVPAPS